MWWSQTPVTPLHKLHPSASWSILHFSKTPKLLQLCLPSGCSPSFYCLPPHFQPVKILPILEILNITSMKSSLTSSHPSIRIIYSFLCVPLKFFSLHCDFNIYSLPPSNTISCSLPNKLLKVKVYVFFFFFVFSQHLTQDILYSKKEKKLEDNASRVFHTRILDLILEKWKHFIHMSLIS